MKKLQVRTAHPLNILTSILKPAGSREAFARANHLLFACLAFFEFSITFLLEDLKTVKQMDSQSTWMWDRIKGKMQIFKQVSFNMLGL